MLLALMKMVHISTTVLQTVEKARSEKLGGNTMPTESTQREANLELITAT
jgi:hypothetical protein